MKPLFDVLTAEADGVSAERTGTGLRAGRGSAKLTPFQPSMPVDSMSFDPTQHRTHPVRPFSDFNLGEVFRAPSRTMTSGIFAAFQAASGDNHPIHYDRAYLERLGHKGLYAHGYMTLIQAAIGASPLAHEMGEALIGFLEQSSRFRAPVYEGDTLYPEFEITALEPGRTTGKMTVAVRIHNQDGTLVCDGEQSYLLRL